jgi:hypothetical protein
MRKTVFLILFITIFVCTSCNTVQEVPYINDETSSLDTVAAASEESTEGIVSTESAESSQANSEEHPDLLDHFVERKDGYWDVVTYRFNNQAVDVNQRRYYPYRYGLADKNEVILVPCEYDRPIEIIRDDRFLITKGPRTYLINRKCEVIYEAISIRYNYNAGYFIALMKDDIYYLVDLEGKVISDKWDYITIKDEYGGFYAILEERLFELGNDGKVIQEIDISPKIINSSHEKIDIVRQDGPLQLHAYYGAVDKNGKVIVPVGKYNRGVSIIGDNCIIASYGYGIFDSTGGDMYDFEGNIITDEYELLYFYKDNGIYTQ